MTRIFGTDDKLLRIDVLVNSAVISRATKTLLPEDLRWSADERDSDNELWVARFRWLIQSRDEIVAYAQAPGRTALEREHLAALTVIFFGAYLGGDRSLAEAWGRENRLMLTRNDGY